MQLTKKGLVIGKFTLPLFAVVAVLCVGGLATAAAVNTVINGPTNPTISTTTVTATTTTTPTATYQVTQLQLTSTTTSTTTITGVTSTVTTTTTISGTCPYPPYC